MSQDSLLELYNAVSAAGAPETDCDSRVVVEQHEMDEYGPKLSVSEIMLCYADLYTLSEEVCNLDFGYSKNTNPPVPSSIRKTLENLLDKIKGNDCCQRFVGRL